MLGTGKVIPTLVIFTISVMMIFSILPVIADPRGPDKDGKMRLCGGEIPNGPWDHVAINGEQDRIDADKNENGWVCTNQMSTNQVIIDDHRPAK